MAEQTNDETLYDRIERRLNQYGNDQDWQKMRAYEMTDIAMSEVWRELDYIATMLRGDTDRVQIAQYITDHLKPPE